MGWSFEWLFCKRDIDGFFFKKLVARWDADIWCSEQSAILLLEMLDEELAKNDLERTELQENLLMQFAFKNKAGEFGYEALNGMGIESSLIKTYKVNAGDVVILASDGYLVICGSLSECEDARQALLQEDLMCFRKYRSTRLKAGNVSFDDRACFSENFK